VRMCLFADQLTVNSGIARNKFLDVRVHNDLTMTLGDGSFVVAVYEPTYVVRFSMVMV
jgi:hypothetical protein